MLCPGGILVFGHLLFPGGSFGFGCGFDSLLFMAFPGALAKDFLQIIAENDFLFQQDLCQLLQAFFILAKNVLGPFILYINQGFDFFIYGLCRFFAVRLIEGILLLPAGIVITQVAYFLLIPK
jgi:hypothetical protein